MIKSKTLDDLVAAYQAAKKSGDSYTIKSAETALDSFQHAEAALVAMRVSEAMSAAVTGFVVDAKKG
ncbi:hypothetical protein [Burkholderia sp. Ac-20344]|uniref:hypothetical protein n=1 Tax=Burkholderia sp. Ac-20344 TaxID=2703890 RepID=UPI00197C4FE1|nr:hypothetical protein [Burkholderia sp. Ac-20344]MBN3836311.1 hypothetical protein [Burkholderia sp. Ac-20344]